MIYHLLPEKEAFSAFRGGAVAKDIANIMRFDDSRIVVCGDSDSTWGYEPHRILMIPEIRSFARLHRSRSAFPAWSTNSFFRRAFRPLLARLRTGDIVWCHSQPAFCAALDQSIHAKNAKLVYHSHSSLAPWFKRLKFRLFEPDAAIFVSDFMRRETLRYLPLLRNTHVVHNGADNGLFYPSSEESSRTTPLVLYVGRLHRTKGVHVLVAAMKILQERGVAVQGKVVGSSFSGGSKVTSYARSLVKLSPSNVQFAGYRSAREIADEYRSADILCCPSIWQEPFGNVNIEAMACGIPVVATRVGGVPEIAADGGVLLVEPNSPVELADALQLLIENRQLRAKLAAEGLASFRSHFTWDIIYAHYRRITESI